MAGMAGMVDANAGTIRGRIRALGDAARALPASLREGALRLTGVPPDAPMKPIELPPEGQEVKESI